MSELNIIQKKTLRGRVKIREDAFDEGLKEMSRFVKERLSGITSTNIYF